MKLKSFGCSFIFGSELTDTGHTNDSSQFSWPALIANKLGYDYQCYAQPAIGNLQIAEQVLIQSAAEDPAFFIIGWTWIDRFDYIPSIDIQNSWRTIMPADATNLAQTYYRKLHSQYRDKLTTLMTVKLTIDTLKQKNQPFIMTYMDDLMFETKWHTTPAVLELQKYILPHMTTFDGQNFLAWSRSNGYPEGMAWHPLESAHAAASDYMIKIFDKQKTIDPVRPARV